VRIGSKSQPVSSGFAHPSSPLIAMLLECGGASNHPDTLRLEIVSEADLEISDPTRFPLTPYQRSHDNSSRS
jgi:hypothetical protein